MVELEASAVWAAAWFAHPGLVALGALLASVPVLIHWWSRRRVRTVDWAAMRLLVGAVQRDERRVRLEDVALLALRVLAVLLLALAVARPFLHRGSLASSMASSMAGDAGGVEYLVLIDDSLSMRSVTSTGTVFERAQRRLRELATTAADTGRDSLTLLLATSPRNPRLERVPLVSSRLDDLLATIDRLEPTDAVVDWPTTLAEFRDWLATRTTGPRRILIASDFRRHDWINDRIQAFPFGAVDSATPNAAPGESLRARSSESRGGEREEDRWLLCDVGESPTDNLYVTDLRADGVVATGVPLQYRATVGNAGDGDARGIEVRLIVADTAPLTTTIDVLPAGATTVVAFPVQFDQDGGTWDVRVDITSSAPDRDNRLAGDDSTLAVAQPVAGLPVALVGNPSPQIGSDLVDDEKTLFLARALSPDDATPAGFLPRVIPNDRWDESALEAFRMVIASDCRVFSVEQVEWLERWVRQGGRLVIAAGATTDVATWNTRLYKDGAGLSPLGLSDIRGDDRRERWQSMRQIRNDFSPLRLLAGDENPYAAHVRIFRWWSTRGASRPTVSGDGALSSNEPYMGLRILARLDDDQASPLMVEKSFGEGRVIQLTIPLDESWSDWPADPSFLIVVQELVRELAQDRRVPTSIFAGEPVVCRLPVGAYQGQAWLRTPSRQRWALEGERGESAAVTDSLSPQLPSDRSAWLLTSPPTRHLGRHIVEVAKISGEREELPVVVNAAPSESQLRRVGDEWGTRDDLPGARRISADTAWLDADGARADWSNWLIWSLAGILFVEQSLAYVVGKRR